MLLLLIINSSYSCTCRFLCIVSSGSCVFNFLIWHFNVWSSLNILDHVYIYNKPLNYCCNWFICVLHIVIFILLFTSYGFIWSFVYLPVNIFTIVYCLLAFELALWIALFSVLNLYSCSIQTPFLDRTVLGWIYNYCVLLLLFLFQYYLHDMLLLLLFNLFVLSCTSLYFVCVLILPIWYSICFLQCYIIWIVFSLFIVIFV